MSIRTALARARRSLRDDLGLHLVASSSLVVAFLCLGGALLAVTNLDALSERLVSDRRITVFLQSDANAGDIAQLRLVLENLDSVARIEHVTPREARHQFLQANTSSHELETLPEEAFPALIEARLAGSVDGDEVERMANRVASFAAVDSVETYRSWLSQMSSLLQTGRTVALLVALLVGCCVLAVVGNTIRLAITSRRDEIEVLKLCGATDGFVRTPFVLEGALQGVLSSGVSVLLLLCAYLVLRSHLDGALATLAGTSSVFLAPVAMLALVAGGGAMGALGSMLALRRHLGV